MSNNKLLRELVSELKSLCPDRWNIEEGAKHAKLYVDNILISVICHGSNTRSRDNKQNLARVRQYLKRGFVP